MEPLVQIDPIPVGMETQPMSHNLPHRPSPGGQPPVGRPGYLPGYPQSGSAVSASQSQGYLPQQAPDSGNYPPGPPPPGSGNYPPGPPPLGGIGYPPGAPPSMGPGYAPAGPAYPPPPQQQQQQSFAPPPGPALADTTLEQAESFQQGVRASRSAAEFALREYMTAQHRRHTTGEAGLEEQLRQQARAAVQDLGSLRRDVLSFAKTAERHRWRRWLIGGILGTFIPGIKRLFRRPEDERSAAANDTEYAFAKSKTLVARILDSVHGKSGLASVAFFVFAVLYVFQNEVALRVAKTVSKRLKRLRDKVERGEEEISEKDVELLKGWRWRILLWSE